MTSKRQVYCISLSEREGHDNLGHTIPEVPTTCSETKFSTKSNCQSDMTPTSVQTKIGGKAAIAIDCTAFIAVILWMSLIEFGLIPHNKQGFYCDDRSIKEKYTGDTITPVLLSLSVFIPFFLFWAVEFALKSDCKPKYRLKKSSVNGALIFKAYFTGLLGKLVIAETLKVLLGELRPHFLDTCQPDKAKNCTGGVYIQDYRCTNTIDSYFFITDSSRSFPSGHSSIAFFEATFLIWYFQRRFPKGRSFTILPFLQCLFLCWACFCATSRITDHRHHWWDVLAGAIMGILFASLTCLVLCKNFRNRKPVDMLKIEQNGSTDRHASVRRLLSDVSTRDEVTMNHINPS